MAGWTDEWMEGESKTKFIENYGYYMKPGQEITGSDQLSHTPLIKTTFIQHNHTPYEAAVRKPCECKMYITSLNLHSLTKEQYRRSDI